VGLPMEVKKILVLGGDGFCGWPVSLRLSNRGHEVIIIDSLIRREIDKELETESLTPIQPIGVRLVAWKEVSGKTIRFVKMDISKDYESFVTFIKNEKPDAIFDFAKLRAAPYSMKSPKHKNINIANNLMGTQHVLNAIVESGLDIHLVHLGTMGVYGYGTPTGIIPEGYLDVYVEKDGAFAPWNILHPAYPGSIYHLTKTQESLFFQFYNKNDGIRITDLHQGIVWGTNTEETLLDERLCNRFDYDGDYGTVLNRFLMQAALNHPLTVYGTGGQTRAFINIRDTVSCLELALNNPPKPGSKVHIYNQMTECHRVMKLAELVSEKSGVKIDIIKNPRKESPENELMVCNDTFLKYGLKPTLLSENLLEEVIGVCKKYASRVKMEKVLPTSIWTKNL